MTHPLLRRATTVAALVCCLARALPSDVFESGSEGVPQYRIPALVQTGAGTLLAFAEARYQPSTDCGYKFLAVRRSTDGGATWSTRSVPVAGVSATNSTSTGNPMAVYHAPSGRVVVVFAMQRLPARYCSPSDGVFVVDDGGSDGMQWSTPRNITSSLGQIAGHTVPGPGAGLVTATGRIVMSGTDGIYGNDTAFYSDDAGATWTPSTTAFPHMDESALVELSDGRVLINMRNAHANASCDCRAIATSSDGGATFTTPVQYDPTLIEPVCQGSLMRVGSKVYFANPADRSARANITVRVGTGLPGGWTGALRVNGSAWGGYTSLAGPLARGAPPQTGGILYEHDDAAPRITFAQFPLDF